MLASEQSVSCFAGITENAHIAETECTVSMNDKDKNQKLRKTEIFRHRISKKIYLRVSKMKNLKTCLRPLLWFSAFFITAIVVGCGGGNQGRDPILGVPAATLVSLSVTPANATIANGAMQQFIATATYGDGASVDVTPSVVWASTTAAAATVNSVTGVAKGVAIGTSVITATFGAKSASANLTVTPATLMSIAVLPATPSIYIGNMQQFIAMGTYSDGSSSDITAVASFSSASPAIASITTTGMATGLTLGSSAISATSGTNTGTTTLTVAPVALVSIAITPDNSGLHIGATQQFMVMGTYSNGVVSTVTSSTSFTSATPAVATVGASTGLTIGIAAGTAQITASFNGKTTTTLVTVSASSLSSIAILPSNPNVLVGSSQQFSATGIYSDGTSGNLNNNVTWTSGTSSVATILQTGQASALAIGSTTISATQGAMTASTTLTVANPAVGAAVNLGGAANFGVLAGTSITNNSGGTTLVTGDVGSPSQTVDPVQAAGFSNYKSGAILSTALADLQAAITNANSRTCDVNSAAGIDLGGLSFGPGVYCYAGAISMTGTFTMNTPGLYIFRTSSTLDTTANSIVALNGGASAGSVFWVPIGPTTLGANSVFKGTIMGQSAAITLGDNASLQNGRVLTGSAATLKNNVISR